jgi:hypothetical protein
VTAVEPGRVLRLSLIVWGLGHVAIDRRATGAALLALEVVGLAALLVLTVTLARGTLDLVPFIAGLAFIGAWAAQAIHAYRAAARPARDDPPSGRPPRDDTPPSGRPAAIAVAWLSIPLLAWSSGFWLIGGESATAAAVVDRFVGDWTEDRLADDGWPAPVRRSADRAHAHLVELCADGELPSSCAAGGVELFRGLRWRIDASGEDALAVAEVVRFERRPTRFLWVFSGTESVPVAVGRVLSLELEAQEVVGPLPISAREWRVVSAKAE